MNKQTCRYPVYARIIHFGLALSGIAAYLTGEFAEGGVNSSGYLLHAGLGLLLVVCLVVRFGVQLLKLSVLSNWSPFNSRQRSMARSDIRSLLTGHIPERGVHEGLAGVVQALGLMLFAWMGVTGTALFFLDHETAHNLFEFVEEAHEAGETLIAVYLCLHIGAVILHSVGGNPIWRRMFTLK